MQDRGADIKKRKRYKNQGHATRFFGIRIAPLLRSVSFQMSEGNFDCEIAWGMIGIV